jgi:hypothetical protein
MTRVNRLDEISETTFIKRIFNLTDQNQKKMYFGQKKPPQNFIFEAATNIKNKFN